MTYKRYSRRRRHSPDSRRRREVPGSCSCYSSPATRSGAVARRRRRLPRRGVRHTRHRSWASRRVASHTRDSGGSGRGQRRRPRRSAGRRLQQRQQVDDDAEDAEEERDESPHEAGSTATAGVDTDGDGVADMDDKCRNTPAGANVNDRGCWEVTDLQFEVGAAAIQPAYHDNLQRIVKILKQNPDIAAEIQGHTDSQGAESMNRDLSERRAMAVRDFLVENGIDPDRLTYKGYGESKPVASNDTPEGRAKNRRVEIKPVF